MKNGWKILKIATEMNGLNIYLRCRKSSNYDCVRLKANSRIRKTCLAKRKKKKKKPFSLLASNKVRNLKNNKRNFTLDDFLSKKNWPLSHWTHSVTHSSAR